MSDVWDEANETDVAARTAIRRLIEAATNAAVEMGFIIDEFGLPDDRAMPRAMKSLYAALDNPALEEFTKP